jgi:hypothetical protein
LSSQGGAIWEAYMKNTAQRCRLTKNLIRASEILFRHTFYYYILRFPL